MQAPAFWWRDRADPGPLSGLLGPLGALWAAAARRRLARGTAWRAPVPVICVGNLTVGGAGKTPVVMALLDRLAARGIAAHALSRGHGGRLLGPVRVDPAIHRSRDVGDEPLLLAALAPAWVSRDRAAGARAAVGAGAQAIIMDDGHQNPALGKDLSILVADAAIGFGNGRVMPAGPLRETLADGLSRAGLLLTLGSQPDQDSLASRWPEAAALPRARGQVMPLATGMSWRGRRLLAFAGIARPQKFFATLEAEGARLLARHAFDDHAEYPARLLARLEREARSLGAQLVTTEKDAVRLPPAFRRQVLVFPVRLRLDDAAALDAALDAVLGPPPRLPQGQGGPGGDPGSSPA
jgi:tetraacyldisaccharide 4'-kinase